MVSPFLFFPDERLSHAELTAACLDGMLVALGEGYIPADAVETAWMRARSLMPILDHRSAAVRTSAAWIHGAVEAEPLRHHLQRASERRRRAAPHPRLAYHDVRLDPADTVHVGGVAVSSPERTLVDLARAGDPAEHDLARAWARAEPDVAARALVWIAGRPRLPHGRRATELLAGATTT